MPISGKGWEMHVVRSAEQRRPSDGKVRTVGEYQIYHDGVKAKGWWAAGMTAETRGPGDNKTSGNNRRVEADAYPLWTQDGTKYDTIGYSASLSPKAYPKPGIELKGTGKRAEILIHPGVGFVASIGCINPCTSLPNAAEMIDYARSRERVILMIEDIKAYLGAAWPGKNGKSLPGCRIVIDGEP